MRAVPGGVPVGVLVGVVVTVEVDEDSEKAKTTAALAFFISKRAM